MKHVKYFITTAALTLLFSLEALASTASISFSDPSVTVGSDVNVTMKVASSDATLARADVTVSYDASLLEFVSGTDASGGAGTVRINGASNGSGTGTLEYNLKFHTLSNGTAAISVQNYDIYDTDESVAELVHQGSSTVSIAAQSTASSNAQLSSLVVSPGTLTPAFSSDTTSYSLIVGTDVDTLAVNAIAADAGASVQVSGNEQLSMGDNTVTITVTAADGTSANYILTVSKQEGGPNTGADDAAAESATTNEGVKLSAKEKTITIMNPGSDVEIPEGFAESTIDIDGHQVKGWVWKQDTDHQYCIVYGMNDAGELNFYRYDLTEKTLQRYFEDPVEQQLKADAAQYPELVTRYDTLVTQYNHMFILACVLAVAVLALLVFVIVLLSRRHPSNAGMKSAGERKRTHAREEKGAAASSEDLEETIPLHTLGNLPKQEDAVEEADDALEETRILNPGERTGSSSSSHPSSVRPALDVEDLDEIDEPTINLKDLHQEDSSEKKETEDLEHTKAFSLPDHASDLEIEDL